MTATAPIRSAGNTASAILIRRGHVHGQLMCTLTRPRVTAPALEVVLLRMHATVLGRCGFASSVYVSVPVTVMYVHMPVPTTGPQRVARVAPSTLYAQHCLRCSALTLRH